MWCRFVRTQLSAYADGELPTTEALAVERHLALCENCARESASLQQVVTMAAAVLEEEVPPSLHSRIMASLAHDAVAPSRAYGGQIRSRAPMRWMFAAVAGGTAALALGLVNRPGATPRTDRQETPVASARPNAFALPGPEVASGTVDSPQARPSEPVIHRAHRTHARRVTLGLSHHPGMTERRRAPSPVCEPASQAIKAPEPLQAPLLFAKPSAEVLAPEPSTASSANRSEPLTMPGSPVVNSSIGPAPPSTESAVNPADSSATRMAGMMSEGQTAPDEDEGLQSLRMFLQERSQTVPQPPLVPARETRRRKS